MILEIEISMKVIFQIMNNLILRWILDKWNINVMKLSHFEMQDRWPKNFTNPKDLVSPI